ncbi:MAG: glycosyltransferase family 2 protein [Fimbriimonadaceae bacterium]|nr:glycosyltransferase family 2 protein [Fimbriimonadaceae bacterium]
MIVVVLPAYNEEAALRQMLPAVAAALAPSGQDWRVLVVDDGSSDGTAAVVQAQAELDPRFLLHPHAVNQGLGRTLRDGLLAALALDPAAAVVVTLDADNTHPLTLIPDLLAALEAEPADVVIASRYAPGGAEMGLTRVRSLLSRCASLFLRLGCPVRGARDYTCGFRAYRRSILQQAREVYGDDFVAEQGFACMAELLIKLGGLGARVAERGLVLRYDLKEGKSKMQVGRTIRRYFYLLRKGRSQWRRPHHQ